MVGFITKYIYEDILVLKYITGSGRVRSGTRRVFIKTRTRFGFFFFFLKTQTRPDSLSGWVKLDPLGSGRAGYPQVRQKLSSLKPTITQEFWDCSTLSRASLYVDQLFKHVLNSSLYNPRTKNVSLTVLHKSDANITHNLRASQHSINTMRNAEFVHHTMGTTLGVYIHTLLH